MKKLFIFIFILSFFLMGCTPQTVTLTEVRYNAADVLTVAQANPPTDVLPVYLDPEKGYGKYFTATYKGNGLWDLKVEWRFKTMLRATTLGTFNENTEKLTWKKTEYVY